MQHGCAESSSPTTPLWCSYLGGSPPSRTSSHYTSLVGFALCTPRGALGFRAELLCRAFSVPKDVGAVTNERLSQQTGLGMLQLLKAAVFMPELTDAIRRFQAVRQKHVCILMLEALLSERTAVVEIDAHSQGCSYDVCSTFAEMHTEGLKMTFEDAVAKALAFREERDWAQFHNPKDLAISITLEAAELLEVFQWSGADLVVESRASEAQDELADVVIYCIYMADALGIDLVTAINDKIKTNGLKYPAESFRGSARKYTEI